MNLPKVQKGFAGALAESFANSKLTPVIILVSLVLGLAAVYLTPKEEEPQISVPMIDVMLPAPGLSASEVERQVTEVVERAFWGLDGVEYVYSASKPHGALITVRFKVNEAIEPSLLKVHHKMMVTRNELPALVGAPEIRSYGIDDVPFLALSFSAATMDDYQLRGLLAPLARDLASTPDLARVELLGGRRASVRVIGRAERLARFGVSLVDLRQAIEANQALFPAGKNWSEKTVFDVDVGARFAGVDDIRQLPVGGRGGKIIKVADVAEVLEGPEARTAITILNDKALGAVGRETVTLSFSKRKGTNVVALAETLLARVSKFQQTLPPGVELSVIRNYGATAGEKSHELIEHLIIATVSVALLIALVMGWRAAVVVAVAIPVTLALTLAIYYFMGYTLNRVTLFALIFSIGILVDDAIVVVENIERYLKTYPQLGLFKATLRAVSEVGNPTVLATFTVIAAILPMAFVRGLMGPYMKPIPVGASLAMVLSLFVAFIVTPWASLKLLKPHGAGHGAAGDAAPSRLDQLYVWLSEHLLSSKRWALGFSAGVLVLLVAGGSFFVTKAVKVKMLPFDDKNEFQISLDFPPATPLAQTVRLTQQLAQDLQRHQQVELTQVFAGLPAPFSFSGMVKHSFLRRSDYQADIHVLLTPKDQRTSSGHDLINELRPLVKTFAQTHGVTTKFLEIPPGPPVLATMVAEVYGRDLETRRGAAAQVHRLFAQDPSIVDLDHSWREGRTRVKYRYDYKAAGSFGTKAIQSWLLGQLVFSDTTLARLDDTSAPEEIPVVLSLDAAQRASERPFAQHTVPSFEAGIVQAEELLKLQPGRPEQILHRKNLRPVEYVTAELAGEEEAPVYSILRLTPLMPFPTQTAEVPWDAQQTIVKWDGEWFITYEVFRDLGAAFAAVMLLIYILVVGWFRSFLVPLVIMAPIPISLIGIVPGHYLFGAYFTATSMIGFIAGAGIIVRNSIILVDFIEHQLLNGMALKDAVISAGVLRFRPMLLTAAAVVVGSAVMLFDPIFQGLALSLIFGEIAATVLSRFAVPVFYYWIIGAARVKQLQADAGSVDPWKESHDQG